MKKEKKSVGIKILIIVTVIVLLLTGGCAIYLGDYYKADSEAISAMVEQGSVWEETDEGNLVFVPDTATKGLIFYPGGKVEHSAYIPLMNACAERDILCIIVKMPFNLAVFDINAADGLCEQYPQIEKGTSEATLSAAQWLQATLRITQSSSRGLYFSAPTPPLTFRIRI